LRADLTEAVWRTDGEPVVRATASIGVTLFGPEMFDREPVHELDGLNLDRLDIECTQYTPSTRTADGHARTSNQCPKCW
jgi:7-cyano-7-deazaguanine reductase